MYNLIFYFFYYYHKTRQGNDPVQTGTGAVSLTILSQIFCAASMLYYFTGIHIMGGTGPKSDHLRIYFIPFLILYYLLFKMIYNKKRVKSIVESWPKDKKVLTWKNSILVFLYFAGPFVIGAQFLNAKH